ncbi:AlpA family transcriptional regulator [Sphingobium sp. JS3065]|nr:AlpA family transcriptional regulator [Sphingobium sp. JS3065]
MSSSARHGSASAADRIIRLPEVLSRTGLKQSTVYRKIADGSFPKQIKLSRNCVGWRESQINDWISAPQ